MAWPDVPADLTDGDYLSASWLNQLAACAAYDQSVGAPSNVGFQEQSYSDAVTLQWRMRHRHRYFKVLYSATGSNTVDYIKIYYNDELLDDVDGGSVDLASEKTLTFDLNDTGVIEPTPTVGSWYTVKIEMAFYSSGSATIHLLTEDSATGDL